MFACTDRHTQRLRWLPFIKIQLKSQKAPQDPLEKQQDQKETRTMHGLLIPRVLLI